MVCKMVEYAIVAQYSIVESGTPELAAKHFLCLPRPSCQLTAHARTYVVQTPDVSYQTIWLPYEGMVAFLDAL